MSRKREQGEGEVPIAVLDYERNNDMVVINVDSKRNIPLAEIQKEQRYCAKVVRLSRNRFATFGTIEEYNKWKAENK